MSHPTPARPNTTTDFVRPDIGCYETDAAPGETALVITHHGKRVMRIEVSDALYSPELCARAVRWVQSHIPPDIKIVP